MARRDITAGLGSAQAAGGRHGSETLPPAALGEAPLRTGKTGVRLPPPPRVLEVPSSIVGGGSRSPVAVPIENLTCPRDGIADSDARGLRSRPEFQVLRPVVVPNAVAMVHRLARLEIAPELRLDHEDVLEDLGRRSGARMIRSAKHHVTSPMNGSPTLPIAVARGCDCPTIRARRGLRLSGSAACTDCRRPARWAAKMPARRTEVPPASFAPSHVKKVCRRCDTRELPDAS